MKYKYIELFFYQNNIEADYLIDKLDELGKDGFVKFLHSHYCEEIYDALSNVQFTESETLPFGETDTIVSYHFYGMDYVFSYNSAICYCGLIHLCSNCCNK